MRSRTLMFVPARSPKLLMASEYADADIRILDLEDGVPLSEKDAARDLLRSYLVFAKPDCEYMIRVNDVHTTAFAEDLSGLKGAPVKGIYLPKIEFPEDVQIADEAISKFEAENQLEPGTIYFFNTVETAMGLENAMACMRASERVRGVCLGSEDFAVSLGIHRSDDYTELDYARRRLVVIAKALGKQAIDTVYANVRDLDGLRRETLYGKSLGYDGKAALTPAQVVEINRMYKPTSDEVAYAEEVLRQWKNAGENHLAVIVVNGKMVDKPVLEQAQRILELAIES